MQKIQQKPRITSQSVQREYDNHFEFAQAGIADQSIQILALIGGAADSVHILVSQLKSTILDDVTNRHQLVSRVLLEEGGYAGIRNGLDLYNCR